MSRPFGFNVVGFISANVGIAVAARNLVRLLIARGCPVALLDIETGLPDVADHTLDSYRVKSTAELPYSINVFAVSMDRIRDLLVHHADFLGQDGLLNTVLVYWELPALPTIWIEALQSFDAVLTPSDFVSATLASSVPNLRTVSTLVPAAIPPGVTAARERWDLPSDETLFVTSFSPFSDVARKNPIAVISAFRKAFKRDDGTGLVIKVNMPASSGSSRDVPGLRPLVAEAKSDKRIRLITTPMSYADVLSLYASCDVFVSLHRAEGFGLGPFEAMRLGKPVISTAWSGNMTFMNRANSCLVRYRLVKVRGSYRYYRSRQMEGPAVWADPSEDDAAICMRRLVDDEELRTAIGRRAALDTANIDARAQRALFVDEIAALANLDPTLDPGRSVRRAHLRHMQTRYAPRRQREIGPLERWAQRHVLWRFSRLR